MSEASSRGMLLSLQEASKRCGISTSRLRRLAAAGVLEAQKVGAYWVVSEEALDKFTALERRQGVRRGVSPPKQQEGGAR